MNKKKYIFNKNFLFFLANYVNDRTFLRYLSITNKTINSLQRKSKKYNSWKKISKNQTTKIKINRIIIENEKELLEIKEKQYITHIKLHQNYLGDLKELPINLIKLTLGKNYDKPLDDLKNKNIQSLTLNAKYNQPIHFLPMDLKKIKFGDFYNKEIKSWPEKLIIIKLGWGFNKPLKDLPCNIRKIILGYKFNNIITWKGENNLKKIGIGQSFNQPSFWNQKMDKIEIIEFDYIYRGYHAISQWPKNLKKIIIRNEVRFDFVRNLPKNTKIVKKYVSSRKIKYI